MGFRVFVQRDVAQAPGGPLLVANGEFAAECVFPGKCCNACETRFLTRVLSDVASPRGGRGGDCRGTRAGSVANAQV